MKAIMYHYVRPPDAALLHFRHLSVESFGRQLDHFGEKFGYVSRDDFERAFTGGAGGALPSGVVLTFDDGFKDHVEFVLPELEQRGLWGIFYVPTSPYVTGRMLDVHRIHILLGRCGGHVVAETLEALVTDAMLTEGSVEAFHAATYQRQQNDLWTLHVKRTLNYYIDYEHRGNVIDALMKHHVPDESDVAKNFYMSPDDLRTMQAAGHVIGSHTANHRVMSKLSSEEQRTEIEGSFAFLEATLGALDPKTFCYPYGGFHTFTDETEKILSEAGCGFAFNVEPRDIAPDDVTRRQALPRFDCNAFPHGQSHVQDAPP
jgi:peptidoglycan/xylan/chitin deacetylase (PgdA/CDA1 family)